MCLSDAAAAILTSGQKIALYPTPTHQATESSIATNQNKAFHTISENKLYVSLQKLKPFYHSTPNLTFEVLNHYL